MLGAVMFVSKILIQAIPYVHLLGLFMASITLTYRRRALIPIYVFIFADGLYWGFSVWWVPYLYVWLPLWMMFMIVGKLKVPDRLRIPLYMVLTALHGLSFGTLYAPAHALMFGLSLQGMAAWIVIGFPFDLIHAVGNFAAGTMIVPLAKLMKRLEKGSNVN
jgi:energy-coupling factor transport system substrate-specific component